MNDSKIEWTLHTLSVSYGCSPVSAGCANCYARTFMPRFAGQARKAIEAGKPAGTSGYALDVLDDSNRWNGTCNPIPEALDKPFRWRNPALVFVDSLSDFFHENLDDDFIQLALRRFGQAHWHRFQLLTKRHERILHFDKIVTWPANCWLGVSVENADVKYRIDALRETSANLKWLSVEPLIGPLGDVDLTNIDWVVLGGESGRASRIRPMDPDWVRSIRQQCKDQGVPMFFKQWGVDANNPIDDDHTARTNGGTTKGGCLLDGQIHRELPSAIPSTLSELIQRKGLDIEEDELISEQEGTAS
jgi:protein gp37